MAILEQSGHDLEVGDKVKMNIEFIRNSDLDGIEFTKSGKNYWRYMCEHPDEVYTVTALDFTYPDCPYVLSGAMSDNTWGSDELIHIPEPASIFEVIKNMTVDEMSVQLIPLLMEVCEDGIPSEELMLEFLNKKPE